MTFIANLLLLEVAKTVAVASVEGRGITVSSVEASIVAGLHDGSSDNGSMVGLGVTITSNDRSSIASVGVRGSVSAVVGAVGGHAEVGCRGHSEEDGEEGELKDNKMN